MMYIIVAIYLVIISKSYAITKNIIYPGTKWCGPGDIAESIDDLGEDLETDLCCRDHDHCEIYLKANESKYGLENINPVARMHCDCDIKFLNCLKQSTKPSARNVAVLYFNTFGLQCFRQDYPKIRCLKYYETNGKRCLTYELDKSKEQVWQWFDIPLF